jgi:alkylhydroperoxidase family enzyme
VEAVLSDYRTAPISERLRAMLGYLEKMTLQPEELGAADLEPLRRSAISDEAIADAVHVCAAFQIYDRLADAMGWHVPVAPSFWRKQAGYLLRSGYEGGRKPRPA